MMFPKQKKVVSEKIRLSAAGESCTLRIEGVCNSRRVTTVLAHLNSKFKGISNKSPDVISVYACSDCHRHLDGGKVSSEDQLRAWQETIMKLIEKELIIIK
jgi:hypothetical protein